MKRGKAMFELIQEILSQFEAYATYSKLRASDYDALIEAAEQTQTKLNETINLLKHYRKLTIEGNMLSAKQLKKQYYKELRGSKTLRRRDIYFFLF